MCIRDRANLSIKWRLFAGPGGLLIHVCATNKLLQQTQIQSANCFRRPYSAVGDQSRTYIRDNVPSVRMNVGGASAGENECTLRANNRQRCVSTGRHSTQLRSAPQHRILTSRYIIEAGHHRPDNFPSSIAHPCCVVLFWIPDTVRRSLST